jgi:demethylmenaquinone methyltransferase/2-methoxy-6-polyprenyl-1,4-benzoquinol methylase
VVQRLRRQAVAALRLRPGDVVLDVGCGVGLSFPLLQQAIGREGRIIGVEQSPDMLARARRLVDSQGWQNVTLLEAAAEEAVIPVQADALLLVLVHDILQSDEALENVLRALRPGGRVVAAGRKWAPWFLWPLNILAARGNRRFQTTFEGLGRPWDRLERLAPGLTVRTVLPGNRFVARGTLAQT